MTAVDLVFIFFAGVAFLGFIINALFYKLKVSNILPLMLIGILAGPVLNLVNVGPGSLASQLTPYISSIAIAFILFDVGLNMKVHKLGKVIARATIFTFACAIATGVVLALMAYFSFGWTLMESFIFGFAVAGPSSIIVPTLMNLINAKQEFKTALLYESVATDLLQLVVPITLIGLIINPITSLSEVASFAFADIVGAILFGMLSALFWLYVLNRYKDQSESYSWMLTVTMVIATYGIANWLGLSASITVFVFGLFFANIGTFDNIMKRNVGKRFVISGGVDHIRSYQREIVFFTSAFFFVYIGVLLNLSGVTLLLGVATGIMVAVLVLVRYLFTPLINIYFEMDAKLRKVDRRIVYFDVSRGLASVIVATIPLTLGINIPGFLDAVFMVILLTNMVSTVGVWYTYQTVRGIKPPRKPAMVPAIGTAKQA